MIQGPVFSGLPGQVKVIVPLLGNSGHPENPIISGLWKAWGAIAAGLPWVSMGMAVSDFSALSPYSSPRQRCLALGCRRLHDLDLVQLLLGSGIQGSPVEDLALPVLEVLRQEHQDLGQQAFDHIRGIGQVKAAMLCAVWELGRRLHSPGLGRVSGPLDAWNILRVRAHPHQEIFYCLCLNGGGELGGIHEISRGLVNRTLVHPREVYAPALEARAVSIMVAHNHPSGRLDPSEDDIHATRRLKESGQILGIPLVDHLIFSKEGFYSFMEGGLL